MKKFKPKLLLATCLIASSIGCTSVGSSIALAEERVVAHSEMDWKEIDGKWYYYNEDGSLHVGWKQFNEKWYYFNEDGSFHYTEGIKKIGGKEYFFNSEGIMLTGWIIVFKGDVINIESYFSEEDGSLVRSREVYSSAYSSAYSPASVKQSGI